jgi:DNA-binding NarL/FixJ family response regulator
MRAAKSIQERFLRPGKAVHGKPRNRQTAVPPARSSPALTSRPAARRKRILLVDDHPLMREGTAQCIGNAPDLEVCGEAGTAAEALEAVDRLKPDLVLTDLTMPGRSGLDLIKDLRTSHPTLPVLVFSIHDETLQASRALRAGARGYLMKAAGGARLLESIRQVLQGRIAVTPETSARLLEEYSGRRVVTPASEIALLTDREFEIFRLLGEARTNREMAAQLHLSHKTVETHRLAILRKLKLKTMSELIRYAIEFCRQDNAGSPG